MWLMTPIGFFSIVEKPGDRAAGTLTVRTRVRTDLDALREQFLPELGDTQTGKGTDYRYRASASRSAVTEAMARVISELDYSNFKNAVHDRQGSARAHLYSKVWDVLTELAALDHSSKPVMNKPKASSDDEFENATAYGGVLVDESGKVLLREPTNHFGGYVWTFAKGTRHAGDTPVESALREVREETGFHAEILASLPGVYGGTTSRNGYFLMRPVGEPDSHDGDEPESIMPNVYTLTVFPAQAGMNRVLSPPHRPTGRVPRAGGDEPPTSA